MYPPAELCFNAVSFVIRAWKGYEGVFESLAGLLEKCSQYLSRLEYYVRGGMDAELSKVACQHLQLLVEICDRAIKLRRKRHKILTFTKLLFLNDSGISDLLQMMDSLVDNEGRLVSAQTFNFASQAAANSGQNLAINRKMDNKIDALVEDKTDQWKEKETRRRREIILRALAFDDDKLDARKKEPDPYWLTAYHNYRNLAIQGTGEWIFNEPKFVAWETGPDGTPPILAIEGAEGSGKSFLASAIIRRLRKNSSTESSGSRDLVAFYFLEGDPKEELKGADNLGVIAKSLVWQLVQTDSSYLKSVVNICQKVEDFDPHEITMQLLLDNQGLSTIDARIFLVIEGADDIGDPLIRFLRKVSSLPPDRDIRVLLTGRPRGIEQLSSESVSLDIIQISEENLPDVEKYIQFKMDRIDALKDTTRLGVSDLRQKICDTLCDKTGGDYFKMDTILKQIRGLDYVHDIDRVLDNAGKERSQHIRGEIEQLNNSRTRKEIGEINEIILWILYGRQWLSPREMSAVLYVKSGELSLLSLETKFQTKYSLFQVDSDGDVDFRSSEIAGLIPERLTYDDAGSADIQHSEVAIIKHFLGTVCPQDIYTKFNFDEFFDRKLRRKSDSICRDDKDTSNVKLAVTCLRILTEERDRRRERLRSYAMNYFLHHLAAADLALAEREWKSAVGPCLVKLFSDELSIDALVWIPDRDETVFSHRVRSAWIDSDQSVDEVLRWLRDSTVIFRIPDKARSWILHMASKPGDLLKPAAKRMAVHWLQESSSVTLLRHAFFFILGFLNKQSNEPMDEDIELIPPLAKVLEIETWAQNILGVEAKDALWEIQMGRLLDNFCYSADAEKRYRHALQLDPSNWRATYNLATIAESPDEAISLLKPKTEYESAAWATEHKELFADILFELGHRYWEKKDYNLAIESYKRCISADVTGYDRALEIMEEYRTESRWSDIQDILSILGRDDQENLSKMLLQNAESEPLHEILLHIAIGTVNHPDTKAIPISSTYEQAIHLATKTNQYDHLFYLRTHHATLLRQRPETESLAIHLWETALKQDLPRSSLDVETTLPSLTVKLGPIYLSRARAASSADEIRLNLQKIQSITPDEAVAARIVLPAKLYLARYYHLTGEEHRAKSLTKSVVKVALELLGGGGADWTGGWKLLFVFLALDDTENAIVAGGLAYRGGHGIVCDGCGLPTGSGTGPESGMWWCKDCIDISFDETCFHRLRDGTLERRVCSPDHDFLWISGVDSIHTIPEGYDGKGEDKVPFTAWKEVIRTKYVDVN